jgi:hypothetical protein
MWDLLEVGQARVGSERRPQLLRPNIPNRVGVDAIECWKEESAGKVARCKVFAYLSSLRAHDRNEVAKPRIYRNLFSAEVAKISSEVAKLATWRPWHLT